MSQNLNEDFIKESHWLAQEFIEFNSNILSPYHAVFNACKILKENGFQQISEFGPWQLQAGGKYFLTKGFLSSLVAFRIPSNKIIKKFNIIATHTDSPNIRVAPKDSIEQQGFLQTNIQLYGGGLWYTWFDRPLKVGGRVLVEKEGKLQSLLYSSKKAVAQIISMCPHLKDSNPLDIDKEKDLKPIIATKLQKEIQEGSLLMKMISQDLQININQIKGFDLCFADSQKPEIFGIWDEFISSSWIDNLFSFFCSIKSIVQSKDDENMKICFGFDHEEIGSQTYVGADSDLLKSILEQILDSLQLDNKQQIIQSSFLLSCDLGHSVHPNYSGFHQQSHKPLINQGIVLKINCNGRYTTDGVSQAYVKMLAETCKVPIQEYIVPAGSRCGSTVGPLLFNWLLCLAADIGAPCLGMHSIRETGGVYDLQ